MKRFAPIAIALVATGAGLASAAPPQESADGMIVDAMTAPSVQAYSGTVMVVQIGDRNAQAEMYRIEHRPPNFTQRIYLSPPRMQGDRTIRRGDDTYFVDAHAHRTVHSVNATPDDQVARDGNYLLMRANYRAVTTGAQSFDGRPTVTIALVNKFSDKVVATVRIDRATKLVLDKQQFAPDGALVSETRFENVSYDTNPSSDAFAVPSTFPMQQGPRFSEVSKDLPAMVQTAGFAAMAPASLPNGFAPVEARVMDRQGARTLHLLYSDGIRTVSLFETQQGSAPDFSSMRPEPTDLGGHPAEYASHGPTMLLSWTQGTVHCTLVGELTLGELRSLATAVR